jgi:hypothetical protein
MGKHRTEATEGHRGGIGLMDETFAADTIGQGARNTLTGKHRTEATEVREGGLGDWVWGRICYRGHPRLGRKNSALSGKLSPQLNQKCRLLRVSRFF